jgi:hypothetical protein
MTDGSGFYDRIARALRGLMAERRVTTADVARFKGSTDAAVRYQLRDSGGSAALANLTSYADALQMTPADLMRELARRITALEAADAASHQSADYVGALELDLDTAANEIASLCDRVRALIRRVEQLGEMAAAC